MCFGNTVVKEDKTSTPDPALTAAAKSNTDFLSNLRNTGYQAYGGPKVADQTPDTLTGADMIRTLAGTSDPYTSTVAGAATNAATAGPQSVSTGRAIDNVPGANGGPAGTTQDYMDPYLASVLAPQLRDIDLQTSKNQNKLDATAAMGGAFGDARTGIQASENTRLGNLARTDTIGQGYSNAFNNAMALKTGDINRNLDVGKTNAALNEQGMARQLAGGNALQALDTHDTGRQADMATLLTNIGNAKQSNDQAKLSAAYEEFAKATGYPLQVAQLIGGTLQPTAYGSNTVTSGPDNSGYGMIAALGGTALKAALAPATGGLSLAVPSGGSPGGTGGGLGGLY